MISGTVLFLRGAAARVAGLLELAILSLLYMEDSSHGFFSVASWFNDAAADSRFTATIGGVANTYFLHSGFALGSSAGLGPKNTIDVFADRAVGGNPFKPFGTWTITF